MSDIFGDVCSKILDRFFEAKHKPYISILFYVLSGIIVGLCVVTLVVPFRCSTEFLDGIVWVANLSNESMIVRLTFGISLAYIIYCLVRRILVRLHQEAPGKKLKRIYTFLYTVDDIIDLLAAICALLFAVSVFLQMYKTGKLFVSTKAIGIYIWIAIRVLAFVARGFAYHNSKIIEGVIKNYPDLM